MLKIGTKVKVNDLILSGTGKIIGTRLNKQYIVSLDSEIKSVLLSKINKKLGLCFNFKSVEEVK